MSFPLGLVGIQPRALPLPAPRPHCLSYVDGTMRLVNEDQGVGEFVHVAALTREDRREALSGVFHR